MLFWVWKCENGHAILRPGGEKEKPTVCGQAVIIIEDPPKPTPLIGHCDSLMFIPMAYIEGKTIGDI